MPSLHEQASRAGRCLFHLDGPAAARHADILAADPAITAIQYVPGAATPSALAKVALLRRIQKAGKPVWVYCLAREVEELCDRLDPRGVVLAPHDTRTPQEVAEIMELINRRYST